MRRAGQGLLSRTQSRESFKARSPALRAKSVSTPGNCAREEIRWRWHAAAGHDSGHEGNGEDRDGGDNGVVMVVRG